MPDPRITAIENLMQDYRAAANLPRIAQLMAVFRAQCPPEGLHLSELERTLQETDAEIDRRVYDLYGLTNWTMSHFGENVIASRLRRLAMTNVTLSNEGGAKDSGGKCRIKEGGGKWKLQIQKSELFRP
jgi:hypothetical protein